MTKKVPTDSPANSPQKGSPKKSSPSKSGRKDGSGVTKDNQEVQDERNQTIVQDFNMEVKKENEYLKFYKFYYDKMKTEHSNWTSDQITKIVSLIWKKKKNQDKMPSAKSASGATSRRSTKPLTAKDAFKQQHKKMQKEEINRIWMQLPHESKQFWKKEGDNYGIEGRLSDISSIKGSKVPLPARNVMTNLLRLV